MTAFVNAAHVPVYSGKPTDYDEWSVEFTAAAEIMELWDIFEAAAPVADAAEAESLAWAAANRKGYALLLRALKPEDRRLVAHLHKKDGAAKAAWDLLKARKLVSGATATNAAMQKLMTNFQREEESLESYLARCTSLWDEHNRLSGTITDAAYLNTVVHGLSQEWDAIQESLLVEGESRWTKENIWSRLLEAEQRR